MDMSLEATKGAVSGEAFVKGYTHGDPNARPRPTGDTFAMAGAKIGVSNNAGGIGAQAAHLPNFGNQVTASAQANLINHNDHNLSVNAFHTKNIPNRGPEYATKGAGVNYNYKDTVALGATTLHIPAAKMHQHSLSSSVTLHQTPTSSLSMSLGASQTTSPFGRGNWQGNGAMIFKKQF